MRSVRSVWRTGGLRLRLEQVLSILELRGGVLLPLAMRKYLFQPLDEGDGSLRIKTIVQLVEEQFVDGLHIGCQLRFDLDDVLELRLDGSMQLSHFPLCGLHS